MRRNRAPIRPVPPDPRFQSRLVEEGVPLDWHIDVPLDHPAFAATQLLSTWALWPADPDRLEFLPGARLDKTAAAEIIRRYDAPAVAGTLEFASSRQ